MRDENPPPLVPLGGKVSDGPPVSLFVAADFVAKFDEFIRQPAQKMRVAVVPIGDPRMRKDAKAEPPVHATLAREQTSSYTASYCSTIRDAVNCSQARL